MESRFVDRTATDEITLANGERVQVRQRLTAPESAELRRRTLSLHVDATSGKVSDIGVNWQSIQIDVCKAYLVGWDFRNADNQPVAYRPELVDELDLETVVEIAQAIDRLQSARREAFQKKGLTS